jgi:hypothetical protein
MTLRKDGDNQKGRSKGKDEVKNRKVSETQLYGRKKVFDAGENM